MQSLFPSITILGLAMFVAAQLALRRTSSGTLSTERVSASKMLALATAIQTIHFIEEWTTGFHIRFPALFGLEPMPAWAFVVFNVAWIAIWVISVRPLRTASKAAFFAAWFLAIAAMLNGVAHPVMAFVSSGYFPGLLTSPFIGLAGIFLWRRLYRATPS